MKNAKSFALCLLALLLFCGAFASCGKKTNELKTGTITETPAESGSAWQPLTAADRAGTDAIYEQKLAATQAFAPLPAVSGKTYYISSIHGDDSNSGTSPDKAWKSPVKAGEVPSGSAVLFECGSVFRRTQNKWFFKAVSNVVYSTYGTGAKPVFYGSVNVPASKWVKVPDKSNLYYFEDRSLSLFDLNNDIGSIIFNEGEAWGVKIQMTYQDPAEKTMPKNKTLALKDVSNGLQTFASIPGYALKNGQDLRAYDLSFYHDFGKARVYLYCEGGNPGARFDSVELAMNYPALQINDRQSNVTILNLDFRYYGNDPVHPMNNFTAGSGAYTFDAITKNITIKNCRFYFIGGTIQVGYGEWRDYYTRLGNGTTNYGACDGFVVENCCFDQIYDTAVTTQTEHNQASRNIVFRNNVMQNVWFGVELWAGDYAMNDLEFDNVEVSGNYCKNIGEGLCSTRPDKVDPGTDYSVNAFIKISRVGYKMRSCVIADNISDGTNGKFIYCSQPKTDANTLDGATFERNIYIGKEGVDFGVLPTGFPQYQPERYQSEDGVYKYRQDMKKYAYNRATVELLQSHGFEAGSKFYYTDSVDCLANYTYKAANKIELPFRLIFPDSYEEGKRYSLITFLNQESASGTDNRRNMTVTSGLIETLSAGQNAILLVPQCPSGTWTGLAVGHGNYETAKVAESEVMKAVAALIRDVAEKYHAQRMYAIGVDAGAYAVSDLLARHKDLLAAGVIISGAGDPSADIGNAKAWIFHASEDDVIDHANADALAAAWNAEYTLYEFGPLHEDCWEYVAKEEYLLSRLLAK